MPKCTFNDEMRTIQSLAEIQPHAIRAFSFKPYPERSTTKSPRRWGLRILNDDYYRYSQLDEPTHETEYLTKDEITEVSPSAAISIVPAARSPPGWKYRRRKGVQVWKTGEGGLSTTRTSPRSSARPTPS